MVKRFDRSYDEYDPFFVTKTRASGVTRQWCGRLGKVDNCQTAVCASLGKGSIATLIDTALFLPQEWTRDRVRMAEAGVPETSRTYRTKQELALDLIERALQNGVQFSWVGFDGFYGDNGQFLRMLDGAGLTFLGDVHCDQYIWTADPTTDKSAKRMRADAWAASQSVDAWRQIEMRHGTKGPMLV